MENAVTFVFQSCSHYWSHQLPAQTLIGLWVSGSLGCLPWVCGVEEPNTPPGVLWDVVQLAAQGRQGRRGPQQSAAKSSAARLSGTPV